MKLGGFITYLTVPLVCVVAVLVSQSEAMAMFTQLFKAVFMRPNFNGVETKWTSSMGSFYNLNAIDIDGEEQKFDAYAGKVTLVVNVACK